MIFRRQSVRPTRARRGLSLTEAAIVMGIAGIVLGAIWVAGVSVYRNMQISQSVGQLITFVQNVRSYYRAQHSFSKGVGTDITPDLVIAEVFPTSMLDASTNLPRSMWSTNIKVSVGTDAAKTTFRVVYDPELPEAVCRNLAGLVAGRGRADGLVSVIAGGSTFSTDDQLNALMATSIAGTCNSLTFTFKLQG